MLGKIEDRGEGATEDEMVGWHHQLNEQESEQTPGDGEGQGSLACCSPWEYAVQGGHSFSSKEQVPFHFMAAVIMCNDFGAQKTKVCHCFHGFLIYLP